MFESIYIIDDLIRARQRGERTERERIVRLIQENLPEESAKKLIALIEKGGGQ